MLKRLQDELPKLWTDEKYSAQFKANTAAHRDFQHALLHAFKAAGELLKMVESADHADGPERGSTYFPQADVEKYLADIVISAIRMATKNPTGQVDLELAVIERVNGKMGAKIEVLPSSQRSPMTSLTHDFSMWACVPCLDGRHDACTGFGRATGDQLLTCPCPAVSHGRPPKEAK